MSLPSLVSATLAVALALAATAADATDATDATDAASPLEATVRQRLDGDRTGACFAVAVVRDAAVETHFACADPKDAGRIGPDSAFEIGSVSKTMTATLLAGLLEAGQGSLEDPLADWLPEGTRVPQVAEGQPIRLRHLVTHSSGLPAMPPGVPLANPADPYAAMRPDDLLAALGRSQPAHAPGQAFEYSNFASMLLSYAVARRAGVDFETLLRERLFAPLGMAGAYVNQRPDGVRAAQGHLPNRQPTPAWTFHGDLSGVGGVRATLADMVAYARAQFGDAPAPLAAAIARTQQPVAGAPGRAMAMNWMPVPLNGRTWLAHEGGTGGFSSFVAVDPAGRRAVVVLSDTAVHSLGGLGSLGLHLMDPGVPLGKPRRAVDAPAALLEALAGDYRLATGLAMTLRVREGRLEIQAEGQPAFAMGHDDAGDFYPLAFDALLRPVRRGDGRYGFTWFQGGGAIEASRVDGAAAPAFEPAPGSLADYVGEYPLMPGFALSVTEREGQLFVQGTGQQALATRAVAPDVFVVEAVGAEFRFERDASGRVVAVALHQGGQVLRGERR